MLRNPWLVLLKHICSFVENSWGCVQWMPLVMVAFVCSVAVMEKQHSGFSNSIFVRMFVICWMEVFDGQKIYCNETKQQLLGFI